MKIKEVTEQESKEQGTSPSPTPHQPKPRIANRPSLTLDTNDEDIPF